MNSLKIALGQIGIVARHGPVIVAEVLLTTLKAERLVLDWRKQQKTRASVQMAIEETLDKLPQTYTKDLYSQKCSTIYQHIYDAYYGEGKSIYETF